MSDKQFEYQRVGDNMDAYELFIKEADDDSDTEILQVLQIDGQPTELIFAFRGTMNTPSNDQEIYTEVDFQLPVNPKLSAAQVVKLLGKLTGITGVRGM